MELMGKLKAVKERKKISQERLAAELGVTLGTINRWFNGKNAPKSKPMIDAIERYVKNNS